MRQYRIVFRKAHSTNAADGVYWDGWHFIPAIHHGGRTVQEARGNRLIGDQADALLQGSDG